MIYKLANIHTLEDKIMRSWDVVEDVNSVLRYVDDLPIAAEHADKIGNLLLGIKELTDLRFQETWEEFVSVCEEYHRMTKELDDLDCSVPERI
tara:strand:- start:127 stop:405 length:279 start_codon:yes stop_codon:yes gene_type:complete